MPDKHGNQTTSDPIVGWIHYGDMSLNSKNVSFLRKTNDDLYEIVTVDGSVIRTSKKTWDAIRSSLGCRLKEDD